MLGASCFGYFVVAVSMLPSIGASQASNARMAVGAGGQSSFVRRDGEDHGKTLQAVSNDRSRVILFQFGGCWKNEGSARKKHIGAMKPSMCLLKAQFSEYEACGMEYPQGQAQDGVAETLDLGEEADPSSCQKELLMNVFPLGDANRVAVYVERQGKYIAFSGCFKNEGDKRQEPNSGVKTLVDCVEEAAKQNKGYFGMEYSGLHRALCASGLPSRHDQG
ncbi:unnamed protein product [Symbiodinium sp. CCMP2592]|nr:unnamed protein product [Symbiodinium sp. CCMP2592]